MNLSDYILQAIKWTACIAVVATFWALLILAFLPRIPQ